MASYALLDTMRPSGCLLVEDAGREASVQDADEGDRRLHPPSVGWRLADPHREPR